MLTCYDASFAAVLDARRRRACWSAIRSARWSRAHDSTLPVTLERHRLSRALRRARQQRALIMADMPFGSYQASVPQSRLSTPRWQLMRAGAQMVKLEGGAWLAPTVAVPGRARHSGVRASRPDAAVGARARRLRVQGKDAEAAADGCSAKRRRSRRPAPACWCSRLVPAALAAEITAAAADPDDRHRRRQRAARARCWCCTTCSTSIPAGSRASCATSCRASASIRAAVGSLRGGGEATAVSRRPEHSY